MTTRQFEDLFAQFLNGYWGAFHELLEAESVRGDRLARSFFQDVVDAHRRFAAVCPPEAKAAMDALDRVWRQAIDQRRSVPDAPLTAAQLHQALSEFSAIHDALVALGARHAGARDRVLARAPHGTPKGPIRVDAAS
jgi:hypothetical protein